MTRGEHLAFCKKRALEYLDMCPPDPVQAFQSMMSDLSKHDETANHIGVDLGSHMLAGDRLSVGEVRRWIEGFN